MVNKAQSDYWLGGLLYLCAGMSGHWLITPTSHPNATTLQYVWIWGQIVVCLLAGTRLLRRAESPFSAS